MLIMFKYLINSIISIFLGLVILILIKPSLVVGIIGKIFTYEQQKKISETLPSIVNSKFLDNHDDLTVENIIDATNNERIKLNMTPFKFNPKLLSSSKRKTEDMINKQYFEHVSPDGKSVSDLGSEVGYNYIIMGENLALGDFTDSADLLEAWMNSPGHRANILNPNYQELGVYIKKGNYQGNDVYFAVQHFGTERGVCPNIESSLKNEIDDLNTDLKKIEGDINTIRQSLESPDRPKGKVYTDLVAYFNQLVTDYNKVLELSQKKIAQYNLEVQAFNKCLNSYQKK